MIERVVKSPLGHLDRQVMEVLWRQGESSVHEVVKCLGRPLAYTTVMTTLDRMFKKHLVVRQRCQRAFRYAARWTRSEWEQKRAGDFVAGFLASPDLSGELLISFLVEAVGEYDAALLDELERKIREKREEHERGEAGPGELS